MSVLPNANFPLLESDQAEVIELYNELLRERYPAGRVMEAPVNRFMRSPSGSGDSGLEEDVDLS